MDWVNFTSAFREATPEVVFPWPPLCCRRTGNFIPLNEEGCRLGYTDYLFTKVCPLPAAPPVCGFSGPLGFFWVFLSPTVSLLSPLLYSFLFLYFSLVLSTFALSVLPPSANQWDAHGVCLIQTWHLQLFSGCLGIRATIIISIAKHQQQPTFIELLLYFRHPSKCFKFLSYFLPEPDEIKIILTPFYRW